MTNGQEKRFITDRTIGKRSELRKRKLFVVRKGKNSDYMGIPLRIKSEKD